MQGTIYRIYCHATNMSYIGSTAKDCMTRFKQHVTASNTQQGHFYDDMRKYGPHCFTVDDIKTDTYPDRRSLHLEEGSFIELYRTLGTGVYNRYVESVDNRPQSEHSKQLKARPFNCECGATVRHDHKHRHLKTAKHRNGLKHKQLYSIMNRQAELDVTIEALEHEISELAYQHSRLEQNTTTLAKHIPTPLLNECLEHLIKTHAELDAAYDEHYRLECMRNDLLN
eukprot:TRINITY_DN8423_c0_g1_i1.p1 TRINITY_DN8423_c0_g1~~TRINITY_DN8423_c0_g1_i1.p1  ORF type:complete len:226 (+),score=47.47 TRINITY_DN8423_c0_g1_i1:171-848(+)